MANVTTGHDSSIRTHSYESLENRIAALEGEVQDLRAVLNQVIQQLRAKAPEKTIGWLTTGAIGKQVGLSSRTIAVWIAEGRIPEKFVRKVPRGSGFLYRLHAEPTVAHIRKVLSGEIKRGDQ